MQIIDSFEFPLTVVFENYNDLQTFCRYLEGLQFEVYHDTRLTFPSKYFVNYNFVEHLVVIK